MLGRGRAGHVVDLVDFEMERVDDVVADDFESRMREEVSHVFLAAREEVVDANHFVATGDEPVAEMTAQEPGSAGHQNRRHVDPSIRSPRAAIGLAV